MMSKLVFALAFCALLHTTISQAKENLTELKIFYTPFEIETYSPITPSTIEEQSHCSFQIEFTNDYKNSFYSIFSNLKRDTFDSKRVRLKLIGYGNAPIYVDSQGRISNKTGEYLLSESQFKDLNKLLKTLKILHPEMCKKF